MNTEESLIMYEWKTKKKRLTISRKKPTEYRYIGEDTIRLFYEDGSSWRESVRIFESDDTWLMFQTETDIEYKRVQGIITSTYLSNLRNRGVK